MEAHKTAVGALAAQVKQFHARQQPFRIYHGSTNSTRQSQHHAHNTISTADLNHVLHVNKVTQTVTVEPNVPMDALVAATLEHGLVPLVVMEFPGITAGGGFSGTSGESSSFRHGFFDATVLQIEIVIPNGEIRSASRTGPTADLFWGAASAFGTLGVVTMLEIQCRPALPFVELTYLSTTSMSAAMDTIRAATADPTIEYLDGIVYARDHIVICAGKLTDAPSAPIQQFTRPHDPWFYLHAQSRAPRASPARKDHIPLQDYLFRYDRGAFWTGRYAYSYFLTPFTRLTRYLLDGFMHTRVMYHALHQSGLAAQYLIQDVAVPYAAAPSFLAWLAAPANFGHYPIWLCPLRVREEGGGLMTTSGRRRPQTPAQAQAQAQTAPGTPSDDDDNDADADAAADAAAADDQYLLNFGLWAPSPHRGAAFIDHNRRLERTVHALGGKKWLYAHAYYTEDEFWAIYDWDRYRGLRERYHAAYLPDLFEKVRVKLGSESENGREVGWGKWARGLVGRVWPVRGLYGVWRACWGGEYYLKG